MMSIASLTESVLERMRDIPGWLEVDEARLLFTSVERMTSSLPAPHAIVEVGSYCGRSTVVLATAARALATDARVYAIDPHEGEVGAADQGVHVGQSTLDMFRQNIAEAGVSGVVEMLQQRSTEVEWHAPISFLFIDALHDYANVAADFRHFERYLAGGALVAFHDYASYYPGVMQFVDELIGSHQFKKLTQVGSMVLLQKQELVREFHDLYWTSNTWQWTFWHGIPTLKCPLDLWIYQEVMWLVKPRLIVELGTFAGGSATFLANMMDAYGADTSSRIMTVDILDDDALAPHMEPYVGSAPFPIRARPAHPRIDYVVGDSVSDAVVERVYAAARDVSPVMVIADSDHSFEHTYRELIRYHPLVTPGSWFVMEDTDGPEPQRAVERFQSEHDIFFIDTSCEKFHMTFNPGGYLRRKPT